MLSRPGIPHSTAAMQWRIRVDTGGTFTDAWAVGPDGVERRAKILSDGTLRCRLVARDGEEWVTDSELAAEDGTLAGWTCRGTRIVASREGARRVKFEGGSPRLAPGEVIELTCGDEAPVAVARLLTGTPAGEALPAIDFRVATTRGTNALLERKGAPPLFIVTRGFSDLLEIRDQRRERLFELAQPVHRPLAGAVHACSGRLDAAGREIEALDESALRTALRAARDEHGLRTAAVALLHAWVNPAHELRVAALLAEEGFTHISLSSAIAPRIRLLPRAETAVADAYLAPIMERFIDRIRGAMGEGEPWMMSSAGGLVPASRFRPKDSLLSGPAGGLVGAAELARAAGFPKVLTFDMGGTSTDVARIDGPFVWRQEQEIGPARVLAPALRIDTVAAGGGSICRWRNGRLEVGPESAGADPGPACYGRGGPLTLTDVNLLLGLMDPGKAGIPLDRAAAEARLQQLLTELREAGEATDAAALLAGLRDIAVETMAEAIRGVSLREGSDPRDFALLAFGGAGPQHACDVADKLGIRRVLVPADAGLLSAWGLERARRQEQRLRQVLRDLGVVADDVPRLWRELAADAKEPLPAADVRWLADLRLLGQDTFVTVEAVGPECPMEELVAAFRDEYRKLYGYPPPAGRAIELVALRVVAEEIATPAEPESFAAAGEAGPLLLQDRFSTCVVPAAWSCRRGARGTLLLERSVGSIGSIGAVPGSVRSALFRSRFEGIVAAMGDLLRRTALSTNVKERLDFSCALLDPAGRLVASAPHVPVHLGALGVCVREVLRVLDPGPGDVVVTNHPGFGGSHLPDVTLIAPVFDASGRRIAFVANRAHHAEIGGKAPGSMPADAVHLAEEGVVIAPRLLVRRGRPLFDEIESLLLGATWPTRRISDNLADLEAQLASIHYGVEAIGSLATTHGGTTVVEELRRILDHSAGLMARRLGEIGDRPSVAAVSALDDGTPLMLGIEQAGGRLKLDFTGTGDVHPRNLNATPAIVRSTVLFALRLWLGEDVPLNEGLLEAVDIVIPPGLLAPDFHGDPAAAPAVVGGNVETSQRLADLLFEALGLAANGPGTMNNFLFGDDGFGYYETIGGGSGGGPRHGGCSGRQVHMTNTAITDPEVLEQRLPVRLWRHEIRRRSGGAGLHPGGDGVIREVEFLKPLTVSFLTGRRASAPRGLAGGQDGKPGRQRRVHPDGRAEVLPGAITYRAAAGERVVIETPGGGGWGAEA